MHETGAAFSTLRNHNGTNVKTAVPNGQVMTPPVIVDLMVEKLFRERKPKPSDSILDPGCGNGAFIKGILNWCKSNNAKIPRITGIDIDRRLIEEVRGNLGFYEELNLIQGDFLFEDFGDFDFIICNPPYVRIEELDESDRKMYRRKFKTAVNRFDLYILFFEKALKSLKTSGRMVFITPEKFEYTETTRPLRRLMAKYHVEEIHHLKEDVFKGLITYPTVTTISAGHKLPTRILNHDGTTNIVQLPSDGDNWVSIIRGGHEKDSSGPTLENICTRISCGVATGADRVFVRPDVRIPENMKVYSHPTVSGKDLAYSGIRVSKRMLVPYDKFGLLPEHRLGEFKEWLYEFKKELIRRSCVKKGNRKWYAFHENPPMIDILRPKILCKDIAKEPRFWLDAEGKIIPRHSVYYIVPKNPEILTELLDFLNSSRAKKWLTANCQRASNGFIRLQSNVLKKLPVEKHLVRR